jgi:hypothetical protein
MSDYRPPTRWDHLRTYFKVCRIIGEPALVAGFMALLGAPWWAFLAVAIVWIPYGRIRVRDLRDEWAG